MCCVVNLALSTDKEGVLALANEGQYTILFIVKNMLSL